MPTTPVLARTDLSGADLISAVAAESIAELTAGMEEDARQIHAAQARFLLRQGEFARRQAFRDEGATSMESWLAERYGISPATARAFRHVAEKAWDLPHLLGSLYAGEISLDKVRAVVDVATPETDRELCDQAQGCSLRQLAEVASLAAASARSAAAGSAPPSRSEHESRYLRCNDEHRTISAQLPAHSYAEAKACLDAQLVHIPSEGETPLDQRRCDAFMGIIRSSQRASSGPSGGPSPFLVVAHVPLRALVDGSGHGTALAGELEEGALIEEATLAQIACDATIALGIDDDVGHTMYEGRARRSPTDAQRREIARRDRHCRFPGCANFTFTNVHHIVPWKPHGRTDLDNLALLCLFHHGVVHHKGWTMTGNANEELTFTSPNGRAMTSRPSPLWTRVTAPAGAPGRVAQRGT
jgi:hypothetical protein